MSVQSFDLAAAAYEEMKHEGFDPDFPAAARQQVADLQQGHAGPPDGGGKDLRHLLWSSIDNDTSRDLDQVEVAERCRRRHSCDGRDRRRRAGVPMGSPIDQHAAAQTTSVYTGVRTFPMLPEELSTDLTSLGEGAARRALVIEFLVAADGAVSRPESIGRWCATSAS